MITTFAWDPGLRESGFAVFTDDELVACGAIYADSDENAVGEKQWLDMMRATAEKVILVDADVFCFEGMSTRKGMESAHGNIIELTTISGMITGYVTRHMGCDFRCIPANRWTHGRKKHINHPIIRKLLSKNELAVLDSELESVRKDNHKEVLDAVGIGLYSLKRFQ